MIGSGGRARLASIGAALALGGCMPTTVVTDGAVAPPPPRIGPTLVIEAGNRSSREIAIGYDFESDQAGGGGEGTAGPCTWTAIPYGEVAGDFRLLVDGVPVHEGEVPRGLPDGVFYVVGVTIGADGSIERVVPPRWTRVAPNPMPRPIIGCG